MSLPANSPQNTKLIVSLCLPLLEDQAEPCHSAHCDFTSFLHGRQLSPTLHIDQHNVFFKQSQNEVVFGQLCM